METVMATSVVFFVGKPDTHRKSGFVGYTSENPEVGKNLELRTLPREISDLIHSNGGDAIPYTAKVIKITPRHDRLTEIETASGSVYRLFEV